MFLSYRQNNDLTYSWHFDVRYQRMGGSGKKPNCPAIHRSGGYILTRKAHRWYEVHCGQ